MKTRSALVAFIAAIAALAALAPPVGATTTAASANPAFNPFFEVHVADLAPVPHDPSQDGGSSTTGKVAFVRIGNQMIVLEFVAGAAANLPHAQHTHGLGVGLASTCPTADRQGEDGLINTVEGVPDYGKVKVSLTTRGDASPASALAVPRFPVANGFGLMFYGRVLEIGTEFPADIAYNIEDFHVVVHGIDVNHNGAYDFGVGESSLDPALPLEATIPAACGSIN